MRERALHPFGQSWAFLATGADSGLRFSLRDRLRAETAGKHREVDDAFSSLDLRDALDLGAFCRANVSLLHAVRILPGRHHDHAKALRAEMQDALVADLRHLGAEPASFLPRRRIDGTSALYILLGSRAGTRLLHRRWQTTRDPTVTGAGPYLGLDGEAKAWRRFCEELGQIPSHSERSDVVVRDAGAMFDLYLAGFTANTPKTGVLHV